jgi:Uma2 family endonuclease
MVQHLPGGYVFDPADPRSPTDEQWNAMTPDERRRVVDMLPSEADLDFLPPMEGDRHRVAAMRSVDTLDGHFRRDKRRIYISGNLPVYYPGERVFAPDVVAVVDVEPHRRERWEVRNEGKGLDFVMEIHVSGDRGKDLKRNVERYARLGIHEYFVFDRGRLSLRGYRLPSPTALAYQPIVPQAGRYESEVLGLELMIEGEGLRYFLTSAPLLDAEERIDRVSAALNDAIRREDEALQRAADAEERAADLARRVAELEAELARLRGG